MNYILINQPCELEPFIPQLLSSRLVAIDTETTGLNPNLDKLRLVQFASFNFQTLIIDCFNFLPDGIPLLTKILTSPLIKIFQNAKFDLQFFLNIGIFVTLPIFDTMLAAQLLHTSDGPSKSNLAALAWHYLQENLNKNEQKSDFSDVLRLEQLEYAAKDAEILLRLRDVMVPQLKCNRLIEVSRLEFSCVRAIAQMEYHGVYLNLNDWEVLRQKTITEKAQSLEKLYIYTGLPLMQTTLFGDDIIIGENFDSNKQMLALLNKNNITVEDTSHHSLMKYAHHPLVTALLEYRRTSKSLSTFLEPLPLMLDSNSRLHPHYGQIGAWSGRMSCGGPNIQQIPRDIAFRSCFTAPLGRKLVLADYSQIELRVAAQIAQDKTMIEAYQNKEDLHKLTAALISKKATNTITKSERQSAKAVNFGLIFAMGVNGLQIYAKDTYGVEMTLKEATEFRYRFFESYSGIAQWHKSLKNNPPTQSRTLSGRKHIYGNNSGLSGLTNTPVQGSAADILKQALGMLVDALGVFDNAFMVAVVHDEILIECNEKDAIKIAVILKSTMESAAAHYLKDVPAVADVEITDSWAEK